MAFYHPTDSGEWTLTDSSGRVWRIVLDVIDDDESRYSDLRAVDPETGVSHIIQGFTYRGPTAAELLALADAGWPGMNPLNLGLAA